MLTRRTVGSQSTAAIALLFLLVGCKPTADVPPGAKVSAEAAAVSRLSPEMVRRGAAVFAANCASCHGVRAEGAKDWHRPGPDGKVPPPPLDGSAHAWHHPRAQLKQIILDGTETRGGGMPAWRGKLSDADVDAVIAWFQSLWPPEIYRAWRELDAKTR